MMNKEVTIDRMIATLNILFAQRECDCIKQTVEDKKSSKCKNARNKRETI